MKPLILWLRTWNIRRKATKHYLAYHLLRDRHTYGKGNLLEGSRVGSKRVIDAITEGKLSHHRNMFNILTDQRATIDPHTHTWRLE